MKNEDLEKRFRCGPVEAAYENSKWFSVFMKVLFLLVAIYFFWLMMGEQHLVEHLDNWAVLAFCLWRIHRQDDVMCWAKPKKGGWPSCRSTCSSSPSGTNSASSTASSRPMSAMTTTALTDGACHMYGMHKSAWRHADFLYPKAFIFLTK